MIGYVNYAILGLLCAAVALSVVTAIAELVCKRNSPAGKFFRFFRIRLREISPFNFVVTSLILLFWGLVFNDDFQGIWAAILCLFIILFALRTPDVIDLTKRRKKARKLGLSPLAKPAPANGAPLLKELKELEPLASDEEEETNENKEDSAE